MKALFDVRTSAARDIITYWLALALAVGTIALVYLVLRSRRGLALAAIRDFGGRRRERRRRQLQDQALGLCGHRRGTGMVGALIYLQKARISPDAAFSVLDWTAYVIFIVVIGGIGTIEGPIVGVLVFYLLQTNLAHFGTWYLMLLGLLRHRRHAVRAKGHLGLPVTALRARTVPHPPPAGREDGRDVSASCRCLTRLLGSPINGYGRQAWPSRCEAH